jgi:hypothetical protein
MKGMRAWHSRIYTCGNFIATTYDYTEEARERLIAKLAEIEREERELLDDYLCTSRKSPYIHTPLQVEV